MTESSQVFESQPSRRLSSSKPSTNKLVSSDAKSHNSGRSSCAKKSNAIVSQPRWYKKSVRPLAIADVIKEVSKLNDELTEDMKKTKH
jgi:hypothetical protein